MNVVGSPLFVVFRFVVGIVGLWVLLLGVEQMNAPSGSFLDAGQHVLAGIAELTFGAILVLAAIAPQQVGAALRVVVRLP